MRLNQEDRDYILGTVREFDENAIVRLFGSMTDDMAKGGDIDLLIESKVITYRDKLTIRYQLKEKLGERKIDLIVADAPRTAFVKYVFENGVVL